MGSGCSSPLRRFGAKKPKAPSSHRNSAPPGSEHDELAAQTHHQHPADIASAADTQQQRSKFVLDNEITVHSEFNDDHPSTTSYLTDAKNHNDESKVSELSAGVKAMPPTNTDLATNQSAIQSSAKSNGSYVLHDRHLLVSPALSPAPSICYSPSPAGSAQGNQPSLDLAELDEAFKCITFGLPDTYGQKIRLPQRQRQHEQQYYTHNLVQSQADLVNSISVLFIIPGTFQFSDGKPNNLAIEALSNHIESHLKTFCDEHVFSLRFLNLSHSHLIQNFLINNLLDATMRILNQEYKQNGQRIVPVILADFNNNGPLVGDRRQLPTRIDAQVMTKLLGTKQLADNEKAKNNLKLWYSQIGNSFHLKPIYLVNQKILSDSREAREQAWSQWLNDSDEILTVIDSILTQHSSSEFPLKLESLFNSCVEFIMREPNLIKRTLLVKNFNQSQDTNSASNQQQASQAANNLNELARFLSDPHKFTLKRSSSNTDELIRSVGDWIHDNFTKFFESISDNQIAQGKHIPPLVERSLFTELTCQRFHFQWHLDNVTESFEARSHNFYTSQVVPILNNISIAHDENSTSPDCLVSGDSQQNAQALLTNHLVFLSGPKGCGKSSLLAQLIKLTVQDLYDRAVIIYRFCGTSLDSLSSNRVLRSICEQFCQTQGENITAASYIYSARHEVMKALNKTIKLGTTVLFLDGLDKFDPAFDPIDWLCEFESSSNIRIFITLDTESELYKKALSTYTDATHISLDNPSINEWAQMITTIAKNRQFNSPGNIYDDVKNLDHSSLNDLRLNYSHIRDIIGICRIRKLNNEMVYPELCFNDTSSLLNINQINETLLLHMQYIIGPYQLCAFLIILNSSRNGLYETDIVNIMSMIPKSKPNVESKFSVTLLRYIAILLKPWLIYITCDKLVKMSIDKEFAKLAIDYYAINKYPNIITDTRDTILDYFNRNTKSKQSKGSLIGGSGKSDSDKAETRGYIDQSEKLWLAVQASEVAHLLVTTNKTKAKEYLLNKQQFFAQFLYGSMPEEFIEDSERLKGLDAKKSSSTNDELQCLLSYIKQSVYPLRHDGFQIYSQIYCRAYDSIKSAKFSKSRKLNDIMNIAQCPPIRSLLPVSETSLNSFIKTRIGQPQNLNQTPPNLNANPNSNSTMPVGPGKLSVSSQQSSATRVQYKQKIFTIKDNHRHVVVIYPDRGSISVWDIFEEKAVRTINNIEFPRDLRMIDQKRAVVLCSRELRVYDLDSGNLLKRLKGVMNQKMPYFEVFNENYVIALARNRMCVNMLNLNTGELETTFKVGEDRFLNSLLVSADGGICVCGDETQKPFPLLVWNLNERRLMFDLRLDRHEFVTRMSAISDDGHFVVSVCKQVESENSHNSPADSSHKASPNFIVIYDLSSGTLFKKWKPALDTCAVAISYSAGKSGKVANTLSDCSILLWDLVTGSKK